MVERSYDGKARWKGINDRLIEKQKDFKRDAEWVASALIDRHLKSHFSFEENLEKRFVEYCEQWKVAKRAPTTDTFEELTFEMIDRAFRLLHAIAKSLLGKKLPKSKGSYSHYDDLFKGPNYDHIRLQVSRNAKMSHQKKLRRSMSKFVEFLKQG